MSNNASFEYDDNFFEEYDDIQMHSVAWAVGLTTLIAYIVIFCFGVPANIYMLCRLGKFAKEDREKYENGTGSGLFVMATADLFSLITISLQHVLPSITISAPEVVKSLACKTLIFATHTMTSISIWSWLLMSTLRYLAIHHPLAHWRFWRAPYHAIVLVVFLTTLTNIWLLFTISNGTTGCTQHTFTIGSVDEEGVYRGLHVVEYIWSFCLPVAAILYMDTMVFFYCLWQSIRMIGNRNVNRFAQEQESAMQPNNTKEENRGLWKWLITASISIMLHTPEDLYRLLTLLGIEVITLDPYYNYTFRMVAQVLYFTQFAFNAVYLSLFILEKNIRPSAPQSSTQDFSMTEMRLSTQGYSSTIQFHRNQYRPLISVIES